MDEAQQFLNGRSPLEIVQDWLGEAAALGLKEPLAMVLATVDSAGVPQARVVLAKQIRQEGIVFFTNYQSPKGQELNAHPKAAANFYWDSLQKQIRLTGSVSRISAEESEAYWRSRPRQSQISAYVSHQSQPVVSREALEQAWKKVEQEYAQKEIPRPAHWGGYLLKVKTVEFWLGKPHRLHDRFLYQRQNENWLGQRLSP